MNLSYAVAKDQGKRRYMEDAHYVNPDFASTGWFFGGVYDGHQGPEAAEYCARKMHVRVADAFSQRFSLLLALGVAYQIISNELLQENSGACAANFIIKDRNIYFANAGDVRMIIIDKKSHVQLTVDHRLTNEAERARIKKEGGVIEDPYFYKGNRGLMITRAIGDQYFHSVGLISVPEVGTYVIKVGDLFLITATDGLYDVMRNEEVAKCARKFQTPEAVANALLNEYKKSEGSDNVTILVASLLGA